MATNPSPLLRKNSTNGKILYAIAYENPIPHVRYIEASGPSEALGQVLKSRSSLGKIVAIAPAIGVFGKSEERKRIYCFGT